jgi:hypothetical protein
MPGEQYKKLIIIKLVWECCSFTCPLYRLQVLTTRISKIFCHINPKNTAAGEKIRPFKNIYSYRLIINWFFHEFTVQYDWGDLQNQWKVQFFQGNLAVLVKNITTEKFCLFLALFFDKLGKNSADDFTSAPLSFFFSPLYVFCGRSFGPLATLQVTEMKLQSLRTVWKGFFVRAFVHFITWPFL